MPSFESANAWIVTPLTTLSVLMMVLLQWLRRWQGRGAANAVSPIKIAKNHKVTLIAPLDMHAWWQSEGFRTFKPARYQIGELARETMISHTPRLDNTVLLPPEDPEALLDERDKRILHQQMKLEGFVCSAWQSRCLETWMRKRQSRWRQLCGVVSLPLGMQREHEGHDDDDDPGQRQGDRQG